MATPSPERGKQIWYNGRIVAADSVKLSLFTHALHYGSGVFEGMRAYRLSPGKSAIFRLRDHMLRLTESLQILGVASPYDIATLEAACTATCAANGFEECYVRPIAFVTDGPLGVFPGAEPPVDVAILTWTWGQYIGNTHSGARLRVGSHVRPHPASAMTKGKITGGYVTGVIAKREALADGYDEALLLDPEGFVAEATGANIFMVKGGVVKTTPLTSVLAGITRDAVIRILRSQGITVEEQRFTRDELYSADEAFLTGSAAEITPIREIDRRAIRPTGTSQAPVVGPLTSRLMQDFKRLTRGEWRPEFAAGWLGAFEVQAARPGER